MSEEKTILLYALSTLAQTCAALAAFVGAVGLYKLQLLGAEHARNEQTIRGILFHHLDRPALVMPLDEVIQMARESVVDQKATWLTTDARVSLQKALGQWDHFANRHQHSRQTLIRFEIWNLAVVAVTVVGFNHVAVLASSPWTFWALWPVAIITAVVTVRSVYAWTRG